MGFPKIRGTISGVPIIRITIFLGLYWGSPYLGKLPCQFGTGKFINVTSRVLLRTRFL